MAMTAKDYELVARAINSALKNNENIIDNLANAFLTTNPHFRTDIFVEECLKDFAPKEKEKPDGIIVGAVYEIQCTRPGDPKWMEEGKHVVLLGIDKWDSEYPLRVRSLDGEEGDPTWIHLEQLGNMVRLP